MADFALSDQQHYDVVVRDFNPSHVEEGAVVNYIPLSNLLSSHMSCDTKFDCSMKATLFCYDYETYTAAYGKEELCCTRWAWRIWLGKGSSFSSGMAGGDACTVGGNKVMFECSDDAPTRYYNGQPLWWNDSIVVGTKVLDPGETLEINELWLTYSRDSTRGLVIGAFSGVEPQPQDDWRDTGILENKVFVARSHAYIAPSKPEEVEPYMEVPLGTI